MSGGARIGVDIGGTFTDLVLIDEAAGALRVGKILTTPKDPAEAVLHGVARLLADAGVPASAIANVIHGTTLATNALIERKGARTGLLTTAGFRDTLEIGREGRYDIYDLLIDPPAPLVPRELRFEVAERVLADGTVLAGLDEPSARAAIEALVAAGVEAVAIALLHAYANPAHEQRLAALVREIAPRLAVSCSSEVVPEIREYERTSTTVANAYVMPLVARYLERVDRALDDLGIPGGLLVMLSSGGIGTPATARRVPVRLVESGPAAGVLAAARAGREAGEARLVSFDMGGTTAKTCLIDDGEPLFARDFEAARADRFKKGSGLPIRVPVIELIEIGAGGGSIARVDRMGLLKVGPDSAGADPGPACYGLGGQRPTVTDADLLLGYLNPEFFLGGRMRLDVEAARRALADAVATPLGLGLVEAAWGVHRVVDEGMAAAARIHAVERGRDLRGYTLFAFGGAGPLHAWQVARILRVRRILIPFGAGATSAFGLLTAPLGFDFVRTARARLAEADWQTVRALYEEMEAEGRAVMASAGVAPAETTIRRGAEMRYVGQGHEIDVEHPPGALGADRLEAIVAAFEAAYRRLFHRAPPGVPIEALNWRVRVSGPAPTVPAAPDPGLAGGEPRKGRRPVFFAEAGDFVDTPVLDRYALRPGAQIEGPAVIEEREATSLVGPGGRARVRADRALVVEVP